ncbi:hypothetical protein BJ741DRAFT_602353 [Chytriomyces cf. hyalinus JEL632]|nr:hypothetical protein BJ741DRAFT_602353 [Chytriomyces cf. hyalinus JEL632]
MAPQGSRYEVTGDNIVVNAVLPSGGIPHEGWNDEESKLQSTTAPEIITEVATTTTSAISFAITTSTTVSSSTSSKISSTTTVSSAGFIPNENSFASNNAFNTADPIAQQPAAYATSAVADPAMLSANSAAVNPLMMIVGGLGLLAAVWLTIFCCVCFQRRRSASRFEQEENDKDNWVPPATYSKDVAAAAGADVSKYNESDYYNSYNLPAGDDYLPPPVNSRAPSVYSQHPSVYSMHNDAYMRPDYEVYAHDNADVATVRNMEKYKSSADTVKMQRHKSSASSVYPNSMFFAHDEDEYGAQVEYEYNVFAKDMSKRKSIADEWRSEIEQAMADTSSNGSGRH